VIEMGLIVDAVLADNLWAAVSDNVKNSQVVDTRNRGIVEFVKAVEKFEKISALRVWGHGYIDRPNGNAIFGADVLCLETIEGFRPALARLRGCFAPMARAEVRGCAAAKANGREMLRKLAEIWSVDVYASEKYQHLVTLWQPPVSLAPAGGGPVKDNVRAFEVGEGR
jgi:hypothetical protein